MHGCREAFPRRVQVLTPDPWLPLTLQHKASEESGAMEELEQVKGWRSRETT